MSHTPKDSPFRLTPEQIAQINACDRPDQIQPLLERFLVDNGNATVNADNNVELVVGPVPRRLVQTVELNGEKHIVEVDVSEGELGLQKAVTDFYRSHANGVQPQPVQQPPQQPRNDRGQFASQEEIERQATEEYNASELRLKMMRGEMSMDEYLEQSGALEKHLERKFGLTPETLERIGGETATQKWADATERFRERHPEWMGGDENRDLMIQLINDSGILDKPGLSPDDVIEAAYAYGCQNDVFVESPAVEHERLLSEAKTQADVDQANHRYAERTGNLTSGGPDWR